MCHYKRLFFLSHFYIGLDERFAALEATLARVNQSEGIIPICAYPDDRNHNITVLTTIASESRIKTPTVSQVTPFMNLLFT